MHLNPYGEYAVLMAASLANDWPADRAGVVARIREGGMTGAFLETPDDHAQVRALIDTWLEVVDETDPDRRALLLNAQMAEATAYPRMTNHDGEGWHLHYRDDYQGLAHVIRAVVTVGTALHLVTRGMHRLARCAASDCDRVVVDVTRNGRQRYCSTRCANRAAVQRHRARVRS
ncbi:CGNR zinc finger domain-containing protein [Microbacterium paludicola]|uniref:CGNR zinc finger domain-containing protein n=1 Tax=Microbacterium paludicola TaxID=300019 RepID=A0A4Y9FM27_9MICO|nr:CGNR zinc finger domain-containing protein [Microbacterium paludicola]MBF0817776.1 CGNR zinc finger domain-containing protein [Microbacterium paludicola]TFU29892.1 CGNR zinc finger domain-containing protein [Microbacterium paludicola]